MSATPVFIGSGFATPCTLIDAISDKRDGSGTYDTVHSGVPSIVRGVKFQAIGTTVDTMLLIFLNDGSTKKLIDEVRVPGIAPTNVNAGWSFTWVPPLVPLFVPSGSSIMAAFHNGPVSAHAWTIGGNVT